MAFTQSRLTSQSFIRLAVDVKAFGITSGQPYMVNMAFDPMLAGCLIYLIQAWDTGGLSFFVFLGNSSSHFRVLSFERLMCLEENKPTTMGSHKDNTIVLKGANKSRIKKHLGHSQNLGTL